MRKRGIRFGGKQDGMNPDRERRVFALPENRRRFRLTFSGWPEAGKGKGRDRREMPVCTDPKQGKESGKEQVERAARTVCKTGGRSPFRASVSLRAHTGPSPVSGRFRPVF